MKVKVHNLFLSYKEGVSVTPYATVEAAMAGLYEWVKNRWQDHGPEQAMPDSHQQAIDLYFHDNWQEYYEDHEGWVEVPFLAQCEDVLAKVEGMQEFHSDDLTPAMVALRSEVRSLLAALRKE